MSEKKNAPERRGRAMTRRDRDVTRLSREFYARYHFPGTRPIDSDGLIFMRRFTRSVDARLRDRCGRRLRVLDAGCGTGNTSIALARRFADADFTGLDNSQPSLDVASRSARGMRNLSFRRWNLMRPVPYARPFDIILCLGVLHHTADMARVLANLSGSLAPDGELYLWVYGRHGRYRHALNVELLRMLLAVKPPPEDPVALAGAYAWSADHGSPLNDLLGGAAGDALSRKTLEDPVWIADQFLNPRECLLDMKELLALARGAGLEICELLGLSEDAASRFGSAELSGRYSRLSRTGRLIALDLLCKPDRYFALLRRIRQKQKK